MAALFGFFFLSIKDQLERIRLEDVAETLVEFAHELDPENDKFLLIN